MSCWTDGGDNFDPERVWSVLMRNEKPGGHGERSVAVGVLDMAIWDLVAKLAEQPLYRLLAERFNEGAGDETVAVYAAGGYYLPGKDEKALVEELKGYLDLGYRATKIKIGAAPLAEDLRRIEAALDLLGGDGSRLAVDANGRFDLDAAIGCGERDNPLSAAMVRGAGRPAGLRAERGAGQ